MKLYWVTYDGYGGEVLIIKAKNLQEAEKLLKESNHNTGNIVTELKLNTGINSLGYFGE